MDLAALIINGSSKDDYNSNFVFDKGWLDVVNSDALISANGLTFTENGGEISVGPSYWAAHNYKIQKDGTERLLLGNFKDTYSSITSLDDWWASNKGEFSAVPTGDLKDGDFVINLKDFNIALNGGGTQYGGYLQANATPNNADGRMIVLGSSDGSFSLSGKSALLTSELYLANNAKITVKEGAHAFIGQSGYRYTAPSEYALSIGSENFKLGSADAPSNGLIEINGSTEIAGGEFYFQGTTNATNKTGIKTFDGDILGSANNISLIDSKFVADGKIELSNTKLALESTNSTPGGTSGNLFDEKWASLEATGDIRLLGSSITTGSSTGLWSKEGSIVLDGSTVLTSQTNTTSFVSSTVLHAKNNVEVLGKDSSIVGYFYASADEGDINIFGKTIDVRCDASVDNLYLLQAQQGNISLVAFEDEDGNSSGANLVLNQRGGHGMSVDHAEAGIGKNILFHGDTGVTLQGTSIHFYEKVNPDSATHSSDTVTITAKKGTIELTGVTAYTSATENRGYGTINIFGQSVSTDEEHNLIDGEYTDVNVKMAGNLYANTINIGNGVGHSKVDIAGTINAIDNTIDTGYNIKLIAGSDGLSLENAKVSYGDAQGGTTTLASKGGNITLSGATIHDNGSEGVGSYDDETKDTDQTAGNLLIQLEEANGTQAILAEAERIISIASTTINDDIITINAAGGSVQLTDSSSVVADNATENEANNGLTVIGSSVSLADGSHFGNVDANGNMVGAKVDVQTSNLALDGTSYITSTGDVSIKSNSDSKLIIAMDQTSAEEEPSWIKGETVNISGNGIGITGGEILSAGEDGDDITISSTGGINLENTVINAGDKGDVIITTGRGTEGSISGTNITGNTINFSGQPGDGDLGQIVVGGGSNITASSNEGSSGQINIGTGVNVIVSNNGSLTANKGTDGETTSPVINVNGGKLTIDQGGEVTSEGNVDVTGGGSIDFTGTADPSTDVDAGKLVAGGALNVGGDKGNGTVNVGAGQTGVIIAGNGEDGANVNIGNGGAINIGKDEDGSNQGSLIIGTGDEALPEAGENGGLAVGDNTTVTVGAGGTLVAGSITSSGSDGDGKVHMNGGTLVTDKDTALGGLGTGLISNDSKDSTLDMSDSSLTAEELEIIRDKFGEESTLVVGTVEGLEGTTITKEDLEDKYSNAVISGAVIDVTNEGTDKNNTLTQGGGGQIQVAGGDDGDGNLNVAENGHVTITGSNSNAEQDLITGGTNTAGGHDIILGDGAHLTFGDSNSAGGVLDGNILLENGNSGDNNVFDVVGGDFNVDGKVDIGNADIVIDGNSNQNGASLTVGEDVTGDSLTMQGTNASMDVGGELNIAGDANLSATGNGGHLITGGAMSVGGHLNVGEGMSIGSEDGSTDTSLEADSITMTGNGSIDRGPVVIGDPEDEESSGDLIMKDESSLTASATEGNDTALDVNGNASIGVKDEGETGEHNPTLNVNGNGDISGDLNQGGGQINVADGGLTVGGDLIQDDGFITIDDLLDINGVLDQEKDGTIVAEGGMDVAGSAAIGGNVTVGVADGDDAKANFGNGLTVESGGSFTNNSAMDGLNEDGSNADTTVTGDLKVGEEGASETASATLGDATVSGKTEINNGNVTTGAFDAEGDVSLDENGHLSATGDIDIGSDTNGNLVVDGGSTVSASANEASGDKGDITVAGSATVNNGSVSAEGALNIGNGLTVNGGNLTAGEKLTVTGGASIDSGTVTANSSSITGDLVVGSADAEEGEEAIFNAGSAPEFAGNVTVEGNGQLNFSGATDFASGNNFIVKDNGSVNEGIDLPDGTSITVNGGFGLGTNGFVNAGDKFALGDESSLVDQEGNPLTDSTLSGFISASQGIDFGSHEITFTGGEDAEGNPILAGTNAHKITGNVTYEDGAKHIFEKLEDHDDAGEVEGVVTIGVGGTLTTNAGFEGDSEKANLFVDGTITLVDETSAIVIGDIGNTSVPRPGVAFGSGAALTIDGTNFVGGDSLFATANGSADIVVGGLQEGEKVSISMDNMSLANGETLIFGNMDEDTANQFEFDSNNILQDYFLNVTDGTGYLGMNLKGADQFGVSNDVSDVVSAVLGNKNENSQKQDLINQVFTEGTGWLTSTTDADGNPVYMVTEAGQQRIQDVLSLPIAAGAFNIAYDAMSEMNQTMANRMAEPITAHSVSVWADVIATYNSADELFGNSGYSADIYAAVMGADVGITEDWIAGVAFTIGQGDADGEGDTMGIQNDADFYGFSVYTAKNVGQLRFSGDMGYLKLKNDISTDVNYGGKGDTDVITVGARMDMTVHQGEQFDVTPHFGIRYANFNIDTINGTATNDINVVEVPLGVTVKGKTSMNGWKVAPMVDVSVVPQFGDKKAKIWNSGVAYEQDVLDSALVKTSVGVSAQKGNFTFGLNYRLGAGNDERQNHSFNANIRYQF